MKTLAICIPTYKRPELLRRCILSAIESAKGRNIKLFIADDSADDFNSFVRNELLQNCSNLTWHVNSENLGIDKNIQNVIDISDCDYAWLCGEDDYFLPGAIAHVHDFLQTADAPFVFANYAYVGEDPNKIIATALPETIDKMVSNHDFIRHHLWASGFIGACVVNRKCWSLTDPLPYSGTYFTHVGRIAEMLAGEVNVLIVSKCCVANRVEGEDNFTWRKDSYGVFFGFLKMSEIVGMRVPNSSQIIKYAAKSFEDRYKWLSLRLAIRLRSQGAFDYLQYRKYLRNVTPNPFKRGLLVVVSVSPPVLFKPIVSCYRFFRNIKWREM